MTPAGAEGPRRRVFVYNGGFVTQRRLRRILQLAGHDVRLGRPRDGDAVAIWGNSPTAHRGRAVAERTGAPLLRVEDAFLRSLHPGRAGEPPMGLCLDWNGVHFDPATPSDLETLLATAPLDDTALLNRARDAIARMREGHLSKYSAIDPTAPPPEPGYVLVVDQTRDDASVRASGGTDALFREMLVFAQEENPGARIVIKSHPETRRGYRQGYYSSADTNRRISLDTSDISPWTLLEGAVGVYTVSSHLGFEAILAGHRPRVFGQPFYAGWGRTSDETPVPRRERRLTTAQLFAAAMILYPTWYDPFTDALCEIETVLDTLDAQARAWRRDRHGWVAHGIRLWKRPHMQRFFGREKRVIFRDTPAPGRNRMAWASAPQASEPGVTRVEDGFLRSRGLGARLVPPLSLVADSSGIYYDPSRPSDLEGWIARRATLTGAQQMRAERLIAALSEGGLTKYNLGGTLPELPDKHLVLVPGQVEDDASVLTGAGDFRSNADLLRAVRAARPAAVIVYKPHPDVEAGLRPGAIDARTLADVVADNADPVALIETCDELFTLTSLIGFEALLRGIPVSTLGAPFYAGWGLTRDMGQVPARRVARPTLAGLVHATLIDYPRYLDPVTGQPCPVEVAVARLAAGQTHQPPMLRGLSKLQGLFASWAHLWR